MLSTLRCRAACLLLAPLAVAVLGCGGNTANTVPVEGSLHWDDGKPIAEASIRFVAAPGGRDANGYTNAEGAFSLNTFTQGDGAVPGSYSVVITKAAPAPKVPHHPPAAATTPARR